MPEPVENPDPNKFYEIDGSTETFCGTCIKDMYEDTAAGRLEGDEVVTPDMVEAVPGTAYQCDGCLVQGDDYDDLVDSDD